MRLYTQMRLRNPAITAGIVLCLVGLSSAALTQTAQPKGQHVEVPASEAGRPSQPQPNWIVTCNQTKPGLECRAGQSLFLRQTRQRVLSVAVRMPADTKKPVLLLQLPLGVYLPAGATLQIGKLEAQTLPYTSCDQGGCIAEYAVTDAELGAIAKGADLTISAQTVQQKPFTLTVPSLGFAVAYAKIK